MLHSSCPLYLCVDAGGTKTAAAIANEQGHVVGRGYGGAANMSELGIEVASREILRATDQAISSLRLSGDIETNDHADFDSERYTSPVGFERIWVGISGCDSPNDVISMTERLEGPMGSRRCGQPSLTVMNDALLLSSSLLRRKTSWGIAVVAGTGSIVLGLCERPSASDYDVFAKRGGHGHLFGDPGSGYHLGLKAISMAADDHGMGQEQSGGLPAVLRKVFGVESTADVPARSHDLPIDQDPVTASNTRKLRIASLAPHVLALSSTCPLAARVLAHVTGALAEDVAVIRSHAKKSGLSGSGGLVITGGLGIQDRYFAALQSALEKSGIRFEWVVTRHDTVTTADEM
ncbi:hypothetical protein CI109_100713 [Kwoniella shandongensis]|uniref:N-acetyl-D-glucosamine kinase n=1 Tax=Kwoniella shandongensis TaxID=1734106 RepID=A0AAJ8MUX4_9TREE